MRTCRCPACKPYFPVWCVAIVLLGGEWKRIMTPGGSELLCWWLKLLLKLQKQALIINPRRFRPPLMHAIIATECSANLWHWLLTTRRVTDTSPTAWPIGSLESDVFGLANFSSRPRLLVHLRGFKIADCHAHYQTLPVLSAQEQKQQSRVFGPHRPIDRLDPPRRGPKRRIAGVPVQSQMQWSLGSSFLKMRVSRCHTLSVSGLSRRLRLSAGCLASFIS
eukprot:217870-Amphidinium_carterae.3